MTEGKRILLAIPWGERTILGTTDTDYNGPLDEVRIEPDLAPDMAWLLARRGNKVVPAAPWGAAHSILVTKKNLQGVADPRVSGSKAEGF